MPSDLPEKQNFQKTSPQMPQALSAVLNSMFQLMPPSKASEIGQQANVPAITTGKPPSETVLSGLRQMAKNNSITDETLQALLMQHFGSRLVIKKKYNHVYGKDGYDCQDNGYSVSLDKLDDCEMKLFDALDYINRPSEPVSVAGKFARMKVCMIRRNESEEDTEILLDTLTNLSLKYPPDIFEKVSTNWMKTKKFFPIPSEFIAELDKESSLRKAILKEFERCRSPFPKAIGKG